MRKALGVGVGGFILFGGTARGALELTSRIRASAPPCLLIGSDLERGAGQQFAGVTTLPPPAALAFVGDPETTRRCGRITAEEARELGLNWVLAPVADLDVESRNPVVATRSFGADVTQVASHVAAWVTGCVEGGAIPCVKHFPGHGRTAGDSHVERPVVDAPADLLLYTDLLPFTAAFAAGAGSVMTAHVTYPALDGRENVATLSHSIIDGLLRRKLGFKGLVVSDAIGMAGLSGSIGEGEAAVRAVLAGCDVLLYPEDPAGVIEALRAAIATGRVSRERLGISIARIERVVRETATMEVSRSSLPAGTSRQDWADEVAMRSIVVLRGDPRPIHGARIVDVDDDLGGPYATPPRESFRSVFHGNGSVSSQGEIPDIVALYSDPRAWKGRAGLTSELRTRLGRIFARSPGAILVIFGHPRLIEGLDFARHVVCAWGGDEVMQRAAAGWLSTRTSDRIVTASTRNGEMLREGPDAG